MSQEYIEVTEKTVSEAIMAACQRLKPVFWELVPERQKSVHVSNREWKTALNLTPAPSSVMF